VGVGGGQPIRQWGGPMSDFTGVVETTLDVTASDIAKGKPDNSQCCPIALAFKRQFPEATRFSVTKTDVCVNNALRVVVASAPLSKEGVSWVADFDEGRPVNPLSLRLRFTTSRSVTQKEDR
jgi:hypothetical protein